MQGTSYEVLEKLKVSVTTKQRTKNSPPAPRPAGARGWREEGGEGVTRAQELAVGSLAEAAW